MAARILAVLIASIGLALTAGGAYLLYLGGSPYYLVCGVAMVAVSCLLWRTDPRACLLYGLIFLATTVWALWESGLDGWALVPRLLAPLVLAVPFLALRSSLAETRPTWSAARMAGAGLAAITIGMVLHWVVGPAERINPVFQTGMTMARAPSVIQRAKADDWPNYGGDLGATRFSALSQITPANVDKLERVWTFRTGMQPAGLQVTPLKVGGLVYVCTADNDVIALDAETGRQRWRHDTNADTRVTSPRCRGLGYYKAPELTGLCAERIITATIDARMVALDAHSGAPCPGFGRGGEISLREGMGEHEHNHYYVTSAPLVVRGKVVVGGNVSDNQMVGEPSGVIRAFDAVTGELAWAWDMGAPDRIGLPPAGQHYTRGTPNSWGASSADDELGLVYVPLGVPTSDFFGGYRRPMDEQFGNTLVALDVETGRLRWAFQTSHHDLWDYDVGQQASLIDLTIKGRVVRALVLPTKRAEVFVLDRVTGKPVFPVVERPVPQRGIAPGERLSPTQPFSTGMPSFRGADLVESDMWGVSPLDQLYCRIRFRKARYDGPHTPPGLAPSIQYPGTAGGMEWGGATVDPTRQLMLINTIYMPMYLQLITRAEANARGMRASTAKDWIRGALNEGYHPPMDGTPYGALTGPFMSPLQVPCKKPPYGMLSAVDLRTGKLVWTRVFGTSRDAGPFGTRSRLPFPMGSPNLGGGTALGSGLYVIGATQDAYLRVYDTATGKQLWSDRLPAAGNATPITYISPPSRRQFIVVAAGGSLAVGAANSDYIVAYALNQK